MMFQSALRDIRARLSSLSNAQDEATTLRRIRTMSDNPVDATQVVRIDSNLRDIEQYRRNSASARTRLNVEDVVLTTMRDLMQKARTLAASVEGLPSTDPTRISAYGEIGQIRDQLVSLGNTKVGNEYIFGGGRTDSPPFLSDGTYLGDSTVRQAEVDDGVRVNTVHSGDQGMSTALAAMNVLAASLAPNAPGGANTIQSPTSNVADAERLLLQLQAETGSRLRELDNAESHLTRRANTLMDRQEAIRDTNPAESLLKLQTAQTALERAYAVVGKVLSTNLLDYLPK
jgi:flagellar hook-associated protein 3 FlgL